MNMRSLDPFAIPSRLEMTRSIEWDVAEAASGFAYTSPGISDADRQLLTLPGAGERIGSGSFATVYRVAGYAIKEVLKGGALDPFSVRFSQSCGWAALRMNVALSDGLTKLPDAKRRLPNGNILAAPLYYGAYEDDEVFRVVMSFEDGVPVYDEGSVAGTHAERRPILDAAMIAAGAEPSATGEYDDIPSDGYTNLLEQPDTSGVSRIVVLDVSAVGRGSLAGLLASL